MSSQAEKSENVSETYKPTDLLGLYGQVNKRIRWMPRQ